MRPEPGGDTQLVWLNLGIFWVSLEKWISKSLNSPQTLLFSATF